MQNETNPPEGSPVNPMNPTARRHARRYALQAMYQWHIANTEIPEIEAEFIASQIDRPTDIDYFKELIYGVPAKKELIDAALTPYLGRPLHEIDPIELSVLRLSTYELLYRLDVPYRVVINEALELTKKFGSIEGFKFVNGVLDRVARKERATEIGMGKK